MTSLPQISTLPSLPTPARASVLDTLFEPCTQLHTLSIDTLHTTTFDSYTSLVAAIGAQLTDLFSSSSTSDTEWLDAILSAHPRLGEPKTTTLSASSAAEQAQLQSGPDSETSQLRALNAEYEKTFPELRYVVFVNGRSRPIIMEDMKSRIRRNDIKQEKTDAIQAMCDIANDRAKKLS